jgi:threonine/homoserine/homoserine lactone efflux protein
MVPSGRLLEFAAVAFVVIVIPGPSVLFVVGRTLAHGRRTALASVAGNELGEFALAAAAALGVGALIQRSAVLFTVMKLAGAAYLVYLGVQAIRHRGSLRAALDVAAEPRSLGRILRDGIVVGVSNPKVIVFFAAVLPKFVNRSAGHVPEQMLLLGSVFLVIAVVCDSSWALAAGTARAWLARSPRRLEMVGGAGGLAMIGIGASLALTGRKD